MTFGIVSGRSGSAARHAASTRSRASSAHACTAPIDSSCSTTRRDHHRIARVRRQRRHELLALPARSRRGERLGHRQRDRAVGDVLGARLQVVLEAAQVEHVVDDLEGEAERLEEAADRVDLRLGAAAGDRAHARERRRRRRRLQADAWRETARSSWRESPVSTARAQLIVEPVEIDGLPGVTGAHRLEVEIVEAQLVVGRDLARAQQALREEVAGGAGVDGERLAVDEVRRRAAAAHRRLVLRRRRR